MNLFKRDKKSTDAEASAIDVVVDGKEKFHLSKKVRLILIGSILACMLVIFLFVFIKTRKNDGARIARKMSEKLGASISVVKDYANVDLEETANCTYLNDVDDDFSAIYESEKTTEVGGVHVPEWAIFCYTNSENKVDQISYYDYTILDKQPVGVKTKGYVDYTAVVNGMTLEKAEELLSIDPFCITYFDDKTAQYKYKYCYKNAETDDLTAYCITILYDADGQVSAAFDESVNFVVDYLTLK